jgi:hypothetical protein
MDIETIRMLVRADPFKPFNLVLTDGRKLPVGKPYYLNISPSGARVMHSSLDGWFEHVRPDAVARIDFDFVDPDPIAAALRRAGSGK